MKNINPFVTMAPVKGKDTVHEAGKQAPENSQVKCSERLDKSQCDGVTHLAQGHDKGKRTTKGWLECVSISIISSVHVVAWIVCCDGCCAVK